jgi:hypothetical protein
LKTGALIPSTIPVPDPTQLTTDAVDRAKKELDIRLTAMKELIDQKFAGVATEFAMRDIALAAAFKAAEAAVEQQNKSNTLAADKAASSFTKQIDGLDEKINDLKERMSDLSIRNYSAIGGYIIGIVGVVGIIVSILIKLNS